MAMVRDLFTVKESAKVYSVLVLILGVSPLLAPTIGGVLTTAFGWRSVFVVLALMGSVLLFVIRFYLKESHQPDSTVSLKVGPIAQNFLIILKTPIFLTYVLSGAVAFSGLFVYLAGSPVIFLETYKVSANVYGSIFAIVAAGMILASQLNVVLLKRFSNEQILMGGMTGQVVVGILLCIGAYSGWMQLIGTVALLFLFMCSFGFTNPNAGALALSPFSKNAGSASALMGFMQMGLGALASMIVGALEVRTMLPVVLIMATGSSLALIILLTGMSRIRQRVEILA